MPLKTPLLLWSLLLSIALPWGASAMELQPFATRNQNPFVQIHGLPPAAPAQVPGKGQLAADLLFNIANSFTTSSPEGEFILFDGETYSTTLSLRYGLSDRVELGMALPYISHNGGFLDSFIEGFHDTFGFDDGNRKSAPSDRLNYTYQRDDNTLFSLTDSANGIGDLRLSAAWQLFHENGLRPGAAALRLSLKLPTGDSDKLFGSGGTDLALSVAAQREMPTEWGQIAIYAALGGLWMLNGDVLSDQQRDLAAFGNLGFGWAPCDWLALKIQADGHTSIYDHTNVDEIGADALQLVTGGTLKLGERTTLDLAVSEDIKVDTAPDVVFHLALRKIF